MKDELYFLVRYIPFWTVPIVIISLELAYVFWIKRKTKIAWIGLTVAMLGVIFLGFYYIAGGPERSVSVVQSWVSTLSE